jgi:hypothetical protein
MVASSSVVLGRVAGAFQIRRNASRPSTIRAKCADSDIERGESVEGSPRSRRSLLQSSLAIGGIFSSDRRSNTRAIRTNDFPKVNNTFRGFPQYGTACNHHFRRSPAVPLNLLPPVARGLLQRVCRAFRPLREEHRETVEGQNFYERSSKPPGLVRRPGVSHSQRIHADRHHVGGGCDPL